MGYKDLVSVEQEVLQVIKYYQITADFKKVFYNESFSLAIQQQQKRCR